MQIHVVVASLRALATHIMGSDAEVLGVFVGVLTHNAQHTHARTDADALISVSVTGNC